jgi:putative ABC transport system permease protein
VWAATGERPIISAGVAIFAAVALLLLGAGVYGVLSQEVETRKHQIAIRLALGATPKQLVLESVRSAVGTSLFGIALGCLFAYLLRTSVIGTVFVPPGVAGPSPISVVASAALLLVSVITSACYGPVRRLANVDPSTALRVQ